MPWVMPTTCPACGSALAARRGRSRLALRERVVPGAAAPRASSTSRRAAAMNIEGLGESLVDQLRRAGAGARLRRPLSPRRPRSSRTSSSRRGSRGRSARVPRKLGKVGRNVVEQIERSKQNDLSRLVYALGIRHVGEKAAATLARHFRTMDGDARGAGRSAAVRSGHRAGRRGVGPRVRRRAAQPRARREAGRGRRQHDEPGAASRARRARAARRQDLRAHRHAALDDARGGDGGARAAGRQVSRLGQQEDDVPWSPAPTPAASSRRRGSSASRRCDEAGVSGAYNESRP